MELLYVELSYVDFAVDSRMTDFRHETCLVLSSDTKFKKGLSEKNLESRRRRRKMCASFVIGLRYFYSEGLRFRECCNNPGVRGRSSTKEGCYSSGVTILVLFSGVVFHISILRFV